MRTVLYVTGVNGFVGYYVASEAADRGLSVVGIGREAKASARVAPFLTDYLSVDLSDKESAATIKLIDTSSVIHLAGLAAVGTSFGNPEEVLRINSSMIRFICEQLDNESLRSIRVINVSTAALFDPQQPMPLNEDSKIWTPNPYAKSKLLGEEIAAEYRAKGFDIINVRPFNHIGPHQRTDFLIPDLLARLRALRPGDKLRVGNLATKRDYSDVRDIARAWVDLATAEALDHNLYVTCSGSARSGMEVLEALCDALNMPVPELEVDQSLFRPNDALEIYGDAGRLRDELGWHTTIEFPQTIRDIVEA